MGIKNNQIWKVNNEYTMGYWQIVSKLHWRIQV